MDVAFEFFYLFARFEFALKALGFHQGEGDAKANWDKFAVTIEADFDEDNLRARKQLKNSFIQCCSTKSDKYGNVIEIDQSKCDCD